MSVRVRFAPSPTGYLHIGGVRTALYNWLFARRHDGRFILRIDDTDQQRNVEEALQPILDGLRWLGLHWDEGPDVQGDCAPYRQSQKQHVYAEAVEKLLEKGLAYRDYATPEELKAEREAAQKEKKTFTYSRRWMADTPEKRKQFESEGRAGVVRLRMPREGTCKIRDLIRGDVSFEWAAEQDHVIQRADGSCLYHLSSVVDDRDMRITHVIRAEEHLSNTPRQVFIAEGLGYPIPEYAHLPFVAEPGSRNKLSKRKLNKYLKNKGFAELTAQGRAVAERIGLKTDDDTFNPVIVDFYEKVGYLPDAIVNYLLLLGWSLDDKTEFFARDEMIRHFSLERVNNAPASFDPEKLAAFQARYMEKLPLDEKAKMVLPYLSNAGLTPSRSEADENRVKAILEAAGTRIKIAGDILEYDYFFFPDDELKRDEKAVEKRLRKPPKARELLSAYREEIAKQSDFDAASLETMTTSFAEAKGIKLGEIIHAVRVASTGQGVGFGLYETLEILGRDRCLARFDLAAEWE